ncbi:MAG: hypothetical protein FWD36_10330 [Treponema sp.]|nr:hypothetical protein [Treponema sp.]
MIVQVMVLAVVFLLFLIIGFAGTIALIQNFRRVYSQGDDVISCVGLEEMEADGLSIFWRPFAFSLNGSELLSAAGNMVIYEQNGIHYIDNDVFMIDKNTTENLDNDFARLVESVVRA